MTEEPRGKEGLMKNLSPSTVIACLALVFALGGTAYAAGSALLPANSVGSKQVINHSIKKIDLKAPLPRGPRGLTGARGSQGPAGLQGPQGPQGLQGSAGITQVIFVDGPDVAQCAASGGACRIATADAVCPSSFRVVGGGHISGGTGNIVLFSAITGTQSYEVIAENLTTSPNTIRASANCVAGPGLTVASPAFKRPNIQSLREALTP
jgi:hypothetical protein